MAETLTIPWRDSGLTARLERAADPQAPLLVLTHGSHGNCDDPLLTALAGELLERGISTVRFNLPWAEHGAATPNSDPVLEAAWRAALRGLKCLLRPARLWAGGRSIGARALVQALQSDYCDVERVVLLGFPLHAPGCPSIGRGTLLQNLPLPKLCIHGRRDAMASHELLQRAAAAAPQCSVFRLDGGDHAFRGLDLNKTARQIAGLTVAWADAPPQG